MQNTTGQGYINQQTQKRENLLQTEAYWALQTGHFGKKNIKYNENSPLK